MNTGKIRSFGLLVALAGSSSGCVLSVAPVISPEQAVLDDRLLGTWEEQEFDTQRAVVTRGSEDTYRIGYSDLSEADEGEARYEARLGRLGGHLVLDVWPRPSDEDLSDAYEGVLIGGHSLFVVEFSEDDMHLSALDHEAMGKALKSGEVELPHHSESGDQIVLLGSTAALMEALDRYIRSEESLSDPGVWRRVEPGG